MASPAMPGAMHAALVGGRFNIPQFGSIFRMLYRKQQKNLCTCRLPRQPDKWQCREWNTFQSWATASHPACSTWHGELP